ncbi:MAG: hypothetical protein ACPGVD_01035 [Flavobacteriales bacterium]
MKFKTILTGISLVVTAFITFGCINNSKGYESELRINSQSDSDSTEKINIWYGVQNRFKKSLIKERLLGVKKLNDFIEHYPSNWINSYDSVVVRAYQGDEITSLVSENNILTPAQIQLLSSLDFSARIEVNVFFKEENSVTKEIESSRMRRSFTIVPKYSAEYKTGYDSLIYFLRTNSENLIDLSRVSPIKIGPDSMEIPGPVTLLFELNKKGKAENIRIETSSNDTNTDIILKKLLDKMPLWKPAKDANNNAVKQELEFTITQSKFGWGC